MAQVIRARQLTYGYADGTIALRGIDFDLYQNQTAILLGPNGSGKTTFTLHLNGLLQGDGELQILGRNIQTWNLKQLRQQVGMVFQSSDEQLFMPSVVEDVMFGLLNSGVSRRAAEEKAVVALERCGYKGNLQKSPQRLSAGEKRRVALAGVLVAEPQVLVLDEPTVYLDPPSRRDLADLLATLPQPKVIITHDTDFAKAVGTEAFFFEAGKISGRGTVDSVIREHDWQFPSRDTAPP